MKYRPIIEFRAQAVVFHALMKMFDRVVEAEEALDPYEVLPIAVFMAFTIEAYINSVGSRKVPLWSHLERAPWKTKINILHEASGQAADWGRLPLQLATRVFTLRDRLAHGKQETLHGPLLDCQETATAMVYTQAIGPSVLEGLDRDWVLQSGEQFYELLKYIGALFKLEPDDYSNFSWGYTEAHDSGGGPKV